MTRLLQKHTGVGMAPILDTKRALGLALREMSLSNSHPINRTATKLQLVLDYSTKIVLQPRERLAR